MTSRPLGLLFRHPQGRALLRSDLERARKSALTVIDQTCSAASRPGSRRSSPSRPRRRGLARYPRRGRLGASRDFPRRPPRLARRGARRALGKVRRVRRVVTGALEIERAQKRIGASLEAAPVVHIADDDLCAGAARASTSPRSPSPRHPAWCGRRPADAFRLDEVKGVAVVPAARRAANAPAPGRSPEVGTDPDYPGRDAARRGGAARVGRGAKGAAPEPICGVPIPARRSGWRSLTLRPRPGDEALLLFVFDLPVREPVRLAPVPRPDRGLEPGHLLRPVPAEHRARPLGPGRGLDRGRDRARSGSGAPRRPALASALGLIVGGAIGNAIDRLAYGAVFDFIHSTSARVLLVRVQRGRRGHRCGVIGLLLFMIAFVLESRATAKA